MYRLLIEKYPQRRAAPAGPAGRGPAADKLGQDEEAPASLRAAREGVSQARIARHGALRMGLGAARAGSASRNPIESSRRCYEEHRQSRYWADATFRLAERAHAAKRYEDAQRLLADLTAAQPDQKLLPHVHYLQGQAAAGRQQWAEVIEAMRPLTEAEDDSPFKLPGPLLDGGSPVSPGRLRRRRRASGRPGRQAGRLRASLDGDGRAAAGTSPGPSEEMERSPGAGRRRSPGAGRSSISSTRPITSSAGPWLPAAS